MLRISRIAFFSGFIFLVNILPLFALQIPKRAEGYVSDYAGMLSPAAKANLENQLRQFENETSNQGVVVTFSSLEGDELENFSIHLAETWRPGQKGRDNGVILLIFKNDRKARIEVGYGLEGALPDALGKLIIENELVPRFRQGDFDGGIERAVSSIILATKGEYKAKPHPGNSENSPLLFFLVLLIFLILPRWISLYGGAMILTSGGYSRRSGLWNSGGFGGGSFGGGGFSGGGGGFGGGGARGSW